jgi:recombination protein RecR
MDSLHRLEELFAHFPGIGPRQAKRFVYYLLNKSPAYISEFIKLIEETKKNTSECSECHRFFIQKTKESKCTICSDSNRDITSLMIVARDSDFETIERSGAYHGLYFILGGTVPILDKEPEKRIRLEKLLHHITSANNPKEIILSLNTTPDGEHTGQIVKEAIQKISPSIKITILGRGLSTGAELEYVDGETIKSALKNRA